jgi:hypothetical protein
MNFKIVTLAALMSVASLVSAQSVTVGYSQRTLDANGQQEHQNALSIKTKQYGSFIGDIGVTAVQNDSTNAITNRYELGGTYTQSLMQGVKGEVRLAHGWKAKSGAETTQYYVIEPSVTASVPSTALSVKYGYRIRNAYEDSVKDNSTTNRLSVGYALSKNDTISLGRDWQRGDGALIQTTLQYSRAF